MHSDVTSNENKIGLKNSDVLKRIRLGSAHLAILRLNSGVASLPLPSSPAPTALSRETSPADSDESRCCMVPGRPLARETWPWAIVHVCRTRYRILRLRTCALLADLRRPLPHDRERRAPPTAMQADAAWSRAGP